MRILFTASPLASHLHAMRPLIRAASAAGHEVAVATGPDLAPDLERLRRSPDLVVYDLTDPVGPQLAAVLGVPAVVHGTSPYAARQVGELTRTRREFATARPFIDPYPATLEPGSLPFTDVRRVRPETPDPAPGERLPLRMQRFPNDRTVLLTFGAHQARPDALITALRVLRDFGVNVLVETGTRIEVAQLGPQPVQVAAAQQLPLAKVLPLCTAVISPGSADLVLGALAYGLPQVCLPSTADQRHHTAAVTVTGAAIGVAPEPLLPGALRRAIADVLAVPAYAQAALVHQASIASMPPAADVLRQLTTPALVA